jgi:glycosyltransferase involved in cell wall biosynthesis
MTSDYLMNYGAIENNIFLYPISSQLKSLRSNAFESDIEKYKFKSMLFDNGKQLITYVGRFVEEKGFDLFFNLAKKGLIDVNFIMIGGSEDQLNENLMSIPNLKIIEYSDSTLISKYLSVSDLHVIPSRSDVWNYTLVEAYSNATRVVASNKTGSALELLYMKDEFLFDYDDFDMMVKTIIRALKLTITNSEKKYYKEISDRYSSENMAKVINDSILTFAKREQ